jgi:hypothetical protein
MKYNLSVRITVMMILFLSCTAPFASVGTATASPGETYSQDPKGLEKQLEPLVKAWNKHDDRAIDQAGKIFSFPDPVGWFGKYFSKDQAGLLATEDQAQVAAFATITPAMMSILAKGQKFRVQVSPADKSAPTKIEPRADAPVPAMPVPIEQFNIAMVAEKGMTMSILCNFVYVDGAYRYVGKGAYPFWSMPDTSKK